MARIIKPKPFNPGTRKPLEPEQILSNIDFHVHKFTSKPKPKDSKRIIVFSMFGEFGCETLGVLYCLPMLLKKFEGYYTIVMGWHGRTYLYKHLVDEYWELNEDLQWLREYSRAFHNDSKNLKRLEKDVAKQVGQLFSSGHFAQLAVGNRCTRCNRQWGDPKAPVVAKCPYCEAPKEQVQTALLSDIKFWKPHAVRLPKPSEDHILKAWEYLKPNSVGVFARGRTCYGRNLQPEFYKKLIFELQNMGYNPIWLGEKSTTQPCPVASVFDFSRTPEARDLELTCAIINNLKFTVQFWTASTRLAGMLGVPYLLFESPDQIWGNGQEGLRRALCDFGPSKLAACHFQSVYNDNDAGIEVVKRCVKEMEQSNFEDVLGVLESPEVVAQMRTNNQVRLGYGS